MALDAGEALESALRTAIAERLGESRFRLWFGDGVHLRLSGDGESLKVQVPNAFFRQWIQGHFSDSLVAAVKSITGRQVRLSFITQYDVDSPPGGSLNQEHSCEPSQVPVTDSFTALNLDASKPSASAPRSTSEREGNIPSPKLGYRRLVTRPPRRLSDLVVGSGNQLAHAAAREMIRTAGSVFNPLFIHGGVGLGKTSLLEATAHDLQTACPGLNILWITAEAFTNSFLDSMRAGTLSNFRARYRGAGALAVDDVHFLAGTRATQGEFLHTFNTLFKRDIPIILTADQHPRQISRLTEELITRFLGGMVVKLEPPDRGMRRAILQAASQGQGVILSGPVLDYMVDNLRISIRELEGTLKTVIAHATLTGHLLDLAMVKSILRDTIQHTRSVIGLREVEQAICRLFQIELDALSQKVVLGPSPTRGC